MRAYINVDCLLINHTCGCPGDISSLLHTIKLLSTVHRLTPELSEKYNKLLSTVQGSIPKSSEKYNEIEITFIQNEITSYKTVKILFLDPETLTFLKKEEDFFQSAVSSQEKLMRHGEMLKKLTDFKELLSQYEQYLAIHADKKTPKKIEIINSLNGILQDKTLPPCMKIYNKGKNYQST